MNRRRFLCRVLVAAVGVPVFGPLVARAFNLATVSQRIRSYDAGTVGTEIPCGATTKVAVVEVATHVEGVAPASSIKVLVALDGEPLWWVFAPSSGRSAPNYVQFLTAPGVWRFEVSLSGVGAPGFSDPVVCEITKA